MFDKSHLSESFDVPAGCIRFLDDTIFSGVQSVRLRLPQGTVVPTSKTTYMCKYYDLPSDSDYHVIGVKPIIGNSKVLRHMVVYGCPDTAGM